MAFLVGYKLMKKKFERLKVLFHHSIIQRALRFKIKEKDKAIIFCLNETINACLLEYTLQTLDSSVAQVM